MGRTALAGWLALVACGCPEQRTADGLAGIGVPMENLSTSTAERLTMTPVGLLDRRLVPECSGFAASRLYPGVVWTHSDSGNNAVVVALRADGSVVQPAGAGAGFAGVQLQGAKNTDWEAVAFDGKGNLTVADMGNNRSHRRDLSLWICPEPDPYRDMRVAATKMPVRYADQQEVPDGKRRFDCEAIFWWRSEWHALTKRHSDTGAVLYRLERQQDGSGLFKPVVSFDSQGLVTDAAVSPDGRMLAVLTYHSVWLFLLPEVGDNPLAGSVLHRWLAFPVEGSQVEAITFLDAERLLIGAEQGQLYTLEISRLEKVR